MKSLIIFHRALQNHRVLKKCGAEIHKRDQLMSPYKRKNEEYNPKMYQEISTEYCNYIKLYLKLGLKISILKIERSKMKESAVAISNKDIIDDQKHFVTVIGKIYDLFKHAGFCRQTRLFSNMIFCLLKDLFKLYKVLEIYNMELLERFEALPH